MLPHLEHENVYVENPGGVSRQHQQAGQVQHLATAAGGGSLCEHRIFTLIQPHSNINLMGHFNIRIKVHKVTLL